MAKLSDKELKELEELEELELLEQEAAPTGQTHEIVRDEEGLPKTVALENQPSKEQIIASSPMEAVVPGAIEGIPFAKDALAATQAALNNQKTFGEEYQLQLAEWNDTLNKAEENHPGAFFAGEMASSLAIGAPSSLVGGAALAGAEMLSRSEDRSVEDVLKGAALSAGFYGTMKGASKAMGFVGKKLGIIADKGIGEAVGVMTSAQRQDLDDHVMKFYGNMKEEKPIREATARWAKEILEETDSKGNVFLTSASTSQDLMQKASLKKEFYGNQIGKVLSDVDNKVGAIIDPKKSERIYKETMEAIRSSINMNDPKHRALLEGLDERIKKTFTTEDGVEKVTKFITGPDGILTPVTETKNIVKFKEMSLSELNKLKQNINTEIRAAHNKMSSDLDLNSKGLKKYSAILTDTINNEMDDLVASGKVDIADGAISSFKELNRKWANMNLIEKFSSKASAAKEVGPTGLLLNALSLRGMMVGAVAASSQLPSYAAATVAISLNQVMRSPSFPSRMQSMFRTVSDHFKNVPDSPYLKRFLTSASISASSEDLAGMKELETQMAAIHGEIKLTESPVKRNLNDIKNKSDLILSALQYHDPDTANELRRALHEGDDDVVRSIMDSASDLPQMKQFFEDGKGIDGRVFDPNKVEQLRQELDSMDISLKQKLMLEKELDMSGKIPVVEEEPSRFMNYRKRDKSKPSY